MSEANVAMLDLETGILHRPGPVHLHPSCGAGPLAACQVGPTAVVRVRAAGLCPRCWQITCPKCGRTSHHPDDVEARYCGACHVYLDQLLAFRLYVEGQLLDERWIDPMSEPGPENTGAAQAAICQRAEAAGLAWQLEIYDPAEDRTVRLGSSTKGMVAPEPIDLDDADSVLRRVAQILGFRPPASG